MALAFDIRRESIASYNHNRRPRTVGYCADIRMLELAVLDRLAGEVFYPGGVIGGPPCQSFSQANSAQFEKDPRHTLPLAYASLLKQLNNRHPVPFFIFENVKGLCSDRHASRYSEFKAAFTDAGFEIREAVLNAQDFGVPQNRERLIIVGFNRQLYPGAYWEPPAGQPRDAARLTVRHAIGGLPEPAYYSPSLDRSLIPYHPNHWCMVPKSKKFRVSGALKPGMSSNRSFKTLSWASPSITVAYGNREVHVHPDCKRRLSVFEAMRLQGFPDRYELLGSLSSQILQVSEAVPPPLAASVAHSIACQLGISADALTV